jgi:transcriptional adapter 2-alpha
MTDFLNKKRKKENEEQEKDNSEFFHLKKAKKDEIQLEPEKINSQIESSIKNPQNKDIEDLIFKYNIKSGIFKCSICQKEITNNIKFYCEECDYIFCINCFLLSKHNNNHGYHLIDALNFPLFIDNWSLKEEHKLLSFVAKCGLNNWEEISKSIENKGQVECESYYYTFYYKNKDNPDPDENKLILDENKNIKMNQLEENKKEYENMIAKVSSNRGLGISTEEEIFPKNNSRSICIPKNGGVGESVSEVLGARIKRKEFDNEFLNDIEVEMSNLEFNENDKYKEKELQIKMDVLKDYNLILKEREARKKFILEKNMLDMNRQNRIESRLSKEEYNLLLFMKPFHRFFENSEFYDLFGNIVIEQQLKLMLKNINKLENEKNTRGGKISTLEDLEKYYENDKGGNKSKKQGKNSNNNSSHNLTITHSNSELHEIKDKEKNNNNINIKDIEENETNLLINRIERYLNYDKAIKDKSIKDIFDKDEFDLIKEMPIARNIFYDIKIKMKNLIIKFEDKNNDINKKENLKEQIKKLIDSYQIEKQTNSDIFDFFSKKYNEIIIFNEEELKKEEENKNKMEEEGLGLKEEKEENKDESIKSNKHKGRNKKIKHKNDEENSNKEKEKMDIK